MNKHVNWLHCTYCTQRILREESGLLQVQKVPLCELEISMAYVAPGNTWLSKWNANNPHLPSKIKQSLVLYLNGSPLTYPPSLIVLRALEDWDLELGINLLIKEKNKNKTIHSCPGGDGISLLHTLLYFFFSHKL